jgi:ABC-type multidrug transport system ATPase subunit
VPLITLENVRLIIDQTVVFEALNAQIQPGLIAVTGDERVGKTTLLMLLAGQHAPHAGTHIGSPAFFWPYATAESDKQTPIERWAQAARVAPAWNQNLCESLCSALSLTEHQHKGLFMLSTGSRRKVDLIANLASGAQVICIDQPYVGLDAPSIGVLREFFEEASDAGKRSQRAWVVADYEADRHLTWDQTIQLTD